MQKNVINDYTADTPPIHRRVRRENLGRSPGSWSSFSNPFPSFTDSGHH